MNINAQEFSDALALIAHELALRDLLALRQVCRSTAEVSLFFWATPCRVRMLLSRHCSRALRAKVLSDLAVPVPYGASPGAFPPAIECALVRDYLAREGVFADPAKFAQDALERALEAGDEAAMDWAAARALAGGNAGDACHAVVAAVVRRWRTGRSARDTIRDLLARKHWLGARIVFEYLVAGELYDYSCLDRRKLACELLAAALQAPAEAAQALAIFARARCDLWGLAADSGARERCLRGHAGARRRGRGRSCISRIPRCGAARLHGRHRGRADTAAVCVDSKERT